MRPTGAGRRCRGDAGVATLLVLATAALLALVASVVVALASVAVARQRAASAADLSALAAAAAALTGPAQACASAAALAERVGAQLASCRLDGDVAVVVAQVRPAGPLGRFGVATSVARAGPGAAAPVTRR